MSLFPFRPLFSLNMKVAKLEQSHLALQGDVKNLITTMTIPQVDLTIVKDIMTKLAMNLGYLLKDPRKCHGGETIDKSTLDKSQSIPKL